MARPLPMAPDSAIGPSNHCRVSATKANGDSVPAWPPAPADTRIRAVGALLDRLVREFLIDHVVKDDAAPAMRGLVELFARAQRSDDHRHLVLLAERQILVEPVVRAVHDLVDGERRRRPLRMRLVMGREFFLDPHQPLVEQRCGARVQRRKRSDDARLALCDHQVWNGNDEQRRTDHGNRQTALEQGRHGHSVRSLSGVCGRLIRAGAGRIAPWR